MRDPFQIRWLVTGIIWAVALFLIYWNGNLMADIRRNQEKTVYAQADNRFLESRAKKISEVIRKKGTYRQSIISLKFGLLSLEEQIDTITGYYGLSDTKINILSDQPGNDSVLIQLSFLGTIENAVRFLDMLQKDSPYLFIDKAAIKMDEEKKEIHFSFSMIYMYRMIQPEITS